MTTPRSIGFASKATQPLYRAISAIRRKPSGPRYLVESFQAQKSASGCLSCIQYNYFSTQAAEETFSPERREVIPNIRHMKASTRRIFGPNSNAQAMLLSGGDLLAENASFDPIYARAKNYIHNHAVGPAVLSPILIHGLVGALIESKLPQGFFVENSLKQVRPLIVGVEVEAHYEITSVVPSGHGTGFNDNRDANDANHIGRIPGYELELETSVRRVSDAALIAEGNQKVWMPDYLQNIN